jgi:hypothetical protein
VELLVLTLYSLFPKSNVSLVPDLTRGSRERRPFAPYPNQNSDECPCRVSAAPRLPRYATGDILSHISVADAAEEIGEKSDPDRVRFTVSEDDQDRFDSPCGSLKPGGQGVIGVIVRLIGIRIVETGLQEEDLDLG